MQERRKRANEVDAPTAITELSTAPTLLNSELFSLETGGGEGAGGDKDRRVRRK